MKKILGFIALLSVGFHVEAKPNYLWIPGHYWGGEFHETQYMYFPDIGGQQGHVMCGLAGAYIHKQDHSPHYSFCVSEDNLRYLRTR